MKRADCLGALYPELGDRLVVTTSRPTIYIDPEGKIAKASPVSTLTSDANTGRAGGYVRLKRFDYVISGGGASPRPESFLTP